MSQTQEGLIQDELREKIVETVRELSLSFGAENVTVRKVLRAMNVSNRVFYNRFRNLDEVLQLVYEEMVLKIRESISARFDREGDFFSQVSEVAVGTLRLSYENKKNFSRYVFQSDSLSHRNYDWWREEIVRLIEFGKQKGFLKDVDTEVVSYAVWCFVRGYNADALSRGVPMEKALEDFRYSFSLLLDGMRA